MQSIATDNNILHKPRRNGAPKGTEAGLRIDPGAMMVVLRTIATPIKSGAAGDMKT